MKYYEVDVIDREIPTAFYAVSEKVVWERAEYLFKDKVMAIRQINEIRALSLINLYREKHKLPLKKVL